MSNVAPVRGLLRHAPAGAAVAVVLAAYAFFAGGGGFDFPRTGWEESYYAGLAEGFFHGHLYMANRPDPRLMALPFPYDAAQRDGKADYIWDASYFNGHYYLYFSPVPLVFYMPYRLLRGGYPRDTLAAAFFAAWAFLAAVAFARRTVAMTGRRLLIPFPVWILLIGFGNVAPFLLMDIRVYEVAILAGTAMTSTWAWALVRYAEAPSVPRAVWMGLWLALSIAARPNLGVLLVATAAVIVVSTNDRWRALAAAAAPPAVVGVAMAVYNAARFGSPSEFGTTYQLTFVAMQGRRVCSLCTLGELSRFANTVMHYLFWAPSFRAAFPFVDLQFANPDPATAFPMPGSEQVVGVIPLVPLTALATLFAVLLILARNRLDAGTRVALQVMGAAWIVLLALSTCWWIVERYSMDFMMLMTAASVVSIESGLLLLGAAGIRLTPLRVAVFALACYSIVTGFLLGFEGMAGAFKRKHPERYERIARRVHL